MSTRELQVRIGINAGSAESQLKALNVNIKNTKSEFDKASAGVDNFDKTTDGAKAKVKALSAELQVSAKKVEIIKGQMDNAKQALEKASSAYETQKQKVEELRKKLEQAEATYGKNSKEVKELSKELKDAEKSFKTKEKAVVSADNKLVNLQTNLNNTEAQIGKLRAEIDKTTTSINNAKFEKMGESLSNAGDLLTSAGNKVSSIGSTLAKSVTGSITAIGTASLMVASDVSEMQSKFETVFGKLSKEACTWADNYSDAIGRSKYEIQEAISNQADLYVGMGFTAKEAFELSKQVTTLGYDLASFNNVNDAQAVEAMMKALMGETESAKMLGVNLTDTVMQTSEFTKATGKSWSQLSMAEKAQVRYKEAVKQSKNAIGDAEKTSNSFTNQLKAAKGNFHELAKSIGDNVLPLFAPLLEKFNAFTQKVVEFTEKNPEAVAQLVELAGKIALIPLALIIVGKVISVIGTATSLFGGLATAIATAGGVGAFFTTAILPIIGVIAGIIAVVILLAGAIKSNFDGIKEACGNLKQSLNENLEPLKEGFASIWTTMQSIYETVIVPLFGFIGELIQVTVQFIADCMPGISTAFQTVCDVLSTTWNTVGKPIFDFVMQIVGQVVDFIKQIMPDVSRIFNEVITAMKNTWENVGKPVWDILKVVIDGVIQALKPIINSLFQACKVAFDAIKSVWDNILKPVWDLLVQVIGGVLDKVKPYMDTFKSVIEGAMNFVLTPIQWVIDKFEKLFGWVGKVADKAGGFISKFTGNGKMIELGANIDTSGVQEFNSIALSGQYYNTRTPRAQEVNDFISGATTVVNKYDNELITVTKEQNKLLSNMLNVLLAERTTIVENSIALDGKQIAKGTAKFVQNELERLTYRNSRLSGSF